MKTSLLSIVFVLLVMNCQKEVTGINDLKDQIAFDTNQNNYTQADSIVVTFTNQSNQNLLFETRSGRMIMFYQMRKDHEWSDRLYFYYSSLRGPSITDTLRPDRTVIQPMPPHIFNSTGTLRLVLDVNQMQGSSPKTSDEITVYSNSFTVR